MRTIIAALIAVASIAITARAADEATLPQPSTTVNTNAVVEFIKVLPNWDNMDSLKAFFQKCGNNVVLNGVYSASTKSGSGFSSGGAAIATSLLDLNLPIGDGVKVSFWALHFGPAVVVGESQHKDGIFTALEAAMFTDPLGVLMEKARSANGLFNIIPKQVDKMYLFIGGGIETFNANRAPIISGGAGYKF